MNNLQWEQLPQPHASNSLWFTISVGLMGLIVGFMIGRADLDVLPSPKEKPAPAPAAQAPTQDARKKQPAAPIAAKDVPPVDIETDHIRGNPEATVAVIEYSDYQCPFCKRHHPTMQKIIDTYGDRVMWVYRHFPLSIHPNAEPAAVASECANELGGNDMFWKFTDAIFEKGFDFAAIAKELGLDEGKFKQCLDSGKYTQHIKDDMAGGSAAGVRGTPGTIVLNIETGKSQLVSGAQSFEAFKTAIDAMLEEK